MLSSRCFLISGEVRHEILGDELELELEFELEINEMNLVNEQLNLN